MKHFIRSIVLIGFTFFVACSGSAGKKDSSDNDNFVKYIMANEKAAKDVGNNRCERLICRGS